MLIEFSNLIDYCLGNTEENRVFSVVVGERKHEVGLSVPAKYSTSTEDLKTAMILQQEILEKKSKCLHLS